MIMETKLVLENLQRYTKKLEEQYPNETAYWHLQKLRNEIERVKNIAYEPVLATVDFVYTGEHEEKGGGRPFLNQLTGKFFYRKDLQRYFTDTQIATINPYGG